MARPICLRLLAHRMREAASRTFWTAGSSRPMRMAMMAMTTSNSISVKAKRARERILSPLGKGVKERVFASRVAHGDGCGHTRGRKLSALAGPGGPSATQLIHVVDRKDEPVQRKMRLNLIFTD